MAPHKFSEQSIRAFVPESARSRNLLQSRHVQPPPPNAPVVKTRRVIVRLLLGAFGLLIVLILALVLAAVFGISINAAPWRQPIAFKASALFGRQVTLEGPLRMTLGLRPELIVGGIVIANPPGFSSP